MAWGYADGRSCFLKYIAPPIPTTNTSAATAWACLTAHPWSKVGHDFGMALVNATTESAWEIWCDDDASSNDKKNTFITDSFPEKGLRDGLPCFSHQTFLGECSMHTAIEGPQFLTDLNSIASFLNTGTHMLRCCLHGIGPITAVLAAGQRQQNVVGIACAAYIRKRR